MQVRNTKMTEKNHTHYIELIPDGHYISNLEETEVYEGICGKNLNINDYKDISDEKAEEIMHKFDEINATDEELEK